ncbi:hypothetical protein GRAN_0116 [Granulicella sibirica]|uniref:Uncharacterized protein n=1 Tax=Granulicella sibirica TaxID=2479048 RepID=A0A4Q0T5B4_9BACT|nr:hypothetical protein GRAN_0116 [Granulicella sibirica]
MSCKRIVGKVIVRSPGSMRASKTRNRRRSLPQRLITKTQNAIMLDRRNVRTRSRLCGKET